MRHAIITALVVIAAATALFAPPIAAARARPPDPPLAGCSYLKNGNGSSMLSKRCAPPLAFRISMWRARAHDPIA
jgi:hypothetical protein